MQKTNCMKIVVLVLCLALTGVLLYFQPAGNVFNPKSRVEQVLSQIKNWQKVSVSPLDPMVVEELKLDDYVFQTYAQRNCKVDLYIGYYYSPVKVGAAHDPLVCFPGQGWEVSGKQQKSLQLSNGISNTIKYSLFLAEKKDEKVLVVYWFQAGDKTAPDTFLQKILLLKNKLLNKSQNNAFVRISTPVNEGTLQEGEQRLQEFMKDFYPIFESYIKSGLN